MNIMIFDFWYSYFSSSNFIVIYGDFMVGKIILSNIPTTTVVLDLLKMLGKVKHSMPNCVLIVMVLYQ